MISASDSFNHNSSKIQPGWKRNPTLVRLHNDLLNAGFESRIVGGNEVEPHSYPHQVAIFIDGFYFCGGSLIGIWHIKIALDIFQIKCFLANDVVLTAAHCMDGAYTARMYFGAHNIWKDEETQIERVSHDFQIHEEWESDILKNDIALIKLTSPIEYSNSKWNY